MSTASAEPGRCPLCGKPNQCALQENPGGIACNACWCMRIEFQAALVQRLREQVPDQACICPACARLEA